MVLFFNLAVWRLLLRQVKNVANDKNFNEKKTEEKETQLDYGQSMFSGVCLATLLKAQYITQCCYVTCMLIECLAEQEFFENEAFLSTVKMRSKSDLFFRERAP